VCSNCDCYASTDALPNVYGYAQDDTDPHPNANRNSHSHGDANSKPKRDARELSQYYTNSESYAYSQANAHSPSQHNTEDTADPAATPIA